MKIIFNNIWATLYSIFSFNFYKSSKELIRDNTRSSLSKIDLNIQDNYVPQGICTIKDLILVTMYDSTHKLNSKVCIIKDGNIIHTTLLDNKAHVGGLCYDDIHDNIWITDRSGTISCYEYQDIINNDEVSAKYKKVQISGLINISGYKAVGYITYFNNRLYMGNYNIGAYSKLYSYELNKDGSINLDSIREYNSYSFTQGIAFIELDSKILAFISSSYGINKSMIRIVDLNTNKVLYKVKMPPMLEQITFNENKNLLALFESNAKIYRKYHFRTHDVLSYKIRRDSNE